MNATISLLFLFGISIASGAVIFRDASGLPLEPLDQSHFPSIAISQNYENVFASESALSTQAESGLPQYLHQGNNVFFKPQFLFPGNAPPIGAFVVPVLGQKGDCDEKKVLSEEPQKYEEPEKYVEPEKHEETDDHVHDEPAIVPQEEQAVLSDEPKEPLVIPAPPELPPLQLPELPVPITTTDLEKPEKEENNHLNDELPPLSESTKFEENPLVIPQPPELPPLVLPELPIQESILPADISEPCEKHSEIALPIKPFEEIPKNPELPLIPLPPVPISIENINHESSKLENFGITFTEHENPKPIIVSVIPQFPHISVGLLSLPVPEAPYNVVPPHNFLPASVPPCPSFATPDYINQLGPQYQVVPLPPYKK